MKLFTNSWLAALIFVPVLVPQLDDATACQAARNLFSAGVSKTRITPQTPIPMSGYGGRAAPFKGVHDELYARVVVFGNGVSKAVLITTDLIGISNSIWQTTTRRISQETGIPAEYILLSAVHNHAGPGIMVYGGEDSSAPVKAYVEELKTRLVTAVNEAIRAMVPVTLGVGKGECKMNINRRAPDGKGGITLGRNPYAPCDHEVGVITVSDRSGQPIALLMNWPCHGTVLGPRNYQVSGDWPGAASAFVEQAFGDKVVAPVTIGASGDINPIYGPHMDFEDNNAYAYGKDAIGEDLGRESMRVSKESLPAPGGSILAVQRVISLPAKEKDEAGKLLRPKGGAEDSVQVRLSVVKLGNIVLTGVSGEVFNQISVKMRSRSPYAYTFMITHCNGSSGYLVADDAYPVPGNSGSENKSVPRGGYETSSTSVRAGAEKAIIDNLLQMIGAL
jgi:neutral ceramidase